MPAEPTALLTDFVHAWEVASTAEALTSWISARLAAYEQALAVLLAFSGPRTPQNSLMLYDQAIEQLNLAGGQAGVLNYVAADKAIRDQAQLEAQRVAMVGNALSLNRAVYEALAAIDLEGASAATRHYVGRTLLGYRLAGVDKDQQTRDLLHELHEKATRLALDFSRNIQEGAKTIQATPDEMDGLPSDYLARHQPDAEGHITLSTDQPDMQPVMTFASCKALRQRMFWAYYTRAYPTNRQILLDLLATRQEIAAVLGFRSWADLATADQMMGSAANVRTFIDKLDEASREGGRREHQLILDYARQQQPELTEIDIASRAYWYEQYRRSAFDFDSQSVRPYFPYAQVEAGILETAAKLFKIEFQRSTAPGWDPSVSSFDVLENGQIVGRFYLDMHPREGKDKWFSAASIVNGARGRALPEAALVCNFPAPTFNEAGKVDDPGFLQYSDVVTYFHEFGHLMHTILGGQTEWVGLSGFATEGDFVEVPSQLLEEFFRDETLLQSFAKHFQTGEALPSKTIEKMKLAGAFGRADSMRSQLFYTSLSLDLHDQNPVGLDLDQSTRQLHELFQPWSWLDGNRMYASFGHLAGYTSNYYTYAFDKVIALDFFAQFDPNDLLGCDVGGRYRKSVLEPGGYKPGRELVRDFLGRDEEFAAFSNWLNEEFNNGLH